MRRVIRWVDPEGYVSVGVEHPRDGEFSLLRGLEDPMRLLQGESFPLGGRMVPVDDGILELEPGCISDLATGVSALVQSSSKNSKFIQWSKIRNWVPRMAARAVATSCCWPIVRSLSGAPAGSPKPRSSSTA